METKRFKRSEFEELLKKATDHCLQSFIEKFADGHVSKEVKYVISALKTDLLTGQQVLEHLLREDGMFRPTIRLIPIARTDSETVISIMWGDDVMDLAEWGEFYPDVPYRSKFEPFFVMGPSL